MGESFRSSVAGVLHDLKIPAGKADTLMVAAVHKHIGAEEGMEKMAGQIGGGMEYILFRMSVQARIGDLYDRAAKVEVDELHSLTDTEDRLF